MNAWFSCALAVLCILTVRLEAHVTKLATDWSLAGHLARGLLPIAFLWALGAVVFQKRTARMVALVAVSLALCLAPVELGYGLTCICR